MIRSFIIALLVSTTIVISGAFVNASPVPQKKVKCLAGMCWRNLDMKKIEEQGCPAPMIIINNILREMNGYLAADKFLNLTPEQKKELRMLRHRCHRKIIKGKSLLNLLSINLLDNMATDKFELSEVEDLISQLRKACSQLVFGVIQDAIDARMILTPEQRKKARDFVEPIK